MQAQLQAQQSGYALQQQQAQLQSILSGQSMGILPPAAYPAAYQQVLNSLLAQQSGAGLGMPSPGLYQASSSGSLRGFDLPATPAGPYPQGLGSMPVDLGQLLAAQAQAADQHATSLHRHTQPAGIPDASQLPHGMPLGLGAAPSLQSTASADMAACLNPMGWGWGGSAGNALLADASRVKPLQPHPDLMLAQAQANARAAASAQSSNVGSVQLPYGGEDRCVRLLVAARTEVFTSLCLVVSALGAAHAMHGVVHGLLCCSAVHVEASAGVGDCLLCC